MGKWILIDKVEDDVTAGSYHAIVEDRDGARWLIFTGCEYDCSPSWGCGGGILLPAGSAGTVKGLCEAMGVAPYSLGMEIDSAGEMFGRDVAAIAKELGL